MHIPAFRPLGRVAALAALLLSSAAMAQGADEVVYRSDFASGPCGFSRKFHYYGQVTLAVDARRRSPAGAASLCATFGEKTKTIIGVTLDVRPGQRIRVELAGAAELQSVQGIGVAVKCVEADGKQAAWLGLGEFPRGDTFARLKSPVVEVPRSTARAYLFLAPRDAVGKLWIADVVVRLVEIPEELEARFAAAGPTNWGINDPFALAYQAPHDATLSDTCAKLMAAVGFDRARVWCWWGSRDQLKNDINKGGAWVFVDKRGGEYDFSELERRLDRVEAYGLRPGPVIIHGTPKWAGGRTDEDLKAAAARSWRARRRPFFPPQDWSEYRRFVQALVSRFKGRVRVWEVMNEPNTPDSGLQGGHRVYMDYLRHFYRAAKQADRDCVVLCSRVGIKWLDLMLRADPSIVDSFDAFVSHPYSDGPYGSLAQVRALQIRMAEAGRAMPIHITEFNFFGGKWRDDKPADVLQREMAERIRDGAPLMATVSNEVTWWNSAFKSNRHGLLRSDGVSLTPLRQYWAFAKVIGKLSQPGGPVRARVEVRDEPVAVAATAQVRLVAENASAKDQRIRFWPVGFVAALGGVVTDVPAREWRGVLAPGQRHEMTMSVTPDAQATGRSFALGLAVIGEQGNSLAITELRVR